MDFNINLLLLPLIGAFIGYFTNFVAIKMLFFPKRASFVFGLRVPFTPGLIPKKRKDIVDKISDVISNNIVKKDDIVRYMYRKDSRRVLYKLAKETMESYSRKKICSINLNYKRIHYFILKFLDEHLDYILKEELKDIEFDVKPFIKEIFLTVNYDKRLIEFLSNKTVDGIKKYVKLATKNILIDFSDSLDSEEMRNLIKLKIIDALNHYVDNSNVLMASFLSMVTPLLEDNEKLVDIVIKQIQDILLDIDVYDRLTKVVFNTVKENFLAKSIKELLSDLKLGNVNELGDVVSLKLDEIFVKLNIKNKIIDSIIKNLNKKKIVFKIVAFIRFLVNRYSIKDVLYTLYPDKYRNFHIYAVNNLLYTISKYRDDVFNFDIGKLAKERLDKLDIESIEDIVLNISKDQFTYINIFGGILGFFIGLIEVVINIHF